MSDLKCEQVRKILPAYLDGEVGRQESETVRRHLDECESCRAQASLLDVTWETLDHGKPPARVHIPDDFTEKVMARLETDRLRVEAESRLRRRRRIGQAVLATVGLAAGLAIGLALYEWRTVASAPPITPVEKEISRNVTFIEDSTHFDEVRLIEEMDRLATERQPGAGA
jgi:predicted anti-sigma-YlaC factor YlaD